MFPAAGWLIPSSAKSNGCRAEGCRRAGEGLFWSRTRHPRPPALTLGGTTILRNRSAPLRCVGRLATQLRGHPGKRTTRKPNPLTRVDGTAVYRAADLHSDGEHRKLPPRSALFPPSCTAGGFSVVVTG